MKILDSIIRDKVIPVLQAGLIDCVYSLHSLIIPTKKGSEIYWVEYTDPNQKRCEPAYLNDRSDLWIAFILDYVDDNPEQSKGKKNIYQSTAYIDVIGYSKTFREAPDYVRSRLSSLSFIELERYNPKSYDILSKVTNVKEYDFSHDLFSQRIKLIFRTDFCDPLTLQGVEACPNDNQV